MAMSVNTAQSILHIVEQRSMETGLVTASAAELAAGIDRDGHSNVYAIYFDTGKAALKPESGPSLAEIGRLMKSKPALKLHVVGHTDNTEQLAMNMKLSADRAVSVMEALTADHGIGAERLDAHGVGPLAPVATNATEEGRAEKPPRRSSGAIGTGTGGRKRSTVFSCTGAYSGATE